MTIQTASIAATPKRRTTQLITAAAGAVLALTAATGLGAWQMSRDGGANVGEQAVAPASAPVRPAARPAAETAPAYYLVASQTQAAAVAAALEEANAVLATSGEPTLAARVELLGSDEAEAAFRAAMSVGDAIRDTLGLPPMRVIDLRAAGEATAPIPAISGRANEGVAPRGGLAELYAEQESVARTEAAQLERMGGLAELYRDQEAAARGAP